MNTRAIIPAVIAILVVALLIGLAWRWQRTLVAGLPPKTDCVSRAEALTLAGDYARTHGGATISVLGTGSMRPYLPAAAAGLAPRATEVAYIVTVPGATYNDIRQGQLCVYRPASAPHESWLHQAAQLDGAGWIMTGLANRQYENWMRLTPAGFLGITAHAFTWPQ